MIVLRKENVVRQVESEEKAKMLEGKGFLRDGSRKKTDLAEREDMAVLTAERDEAREQLAEALKQVAALKQELDGVKEQLEVALKQNREAAAETKAGTARKK